MIQSALSSHKDCYTEHAENQFFEDQEYDCKRIDMLEQKFSNIDASIRVLKRPTLLTRPSAIDRIKLHVPNAKFIVVLRDPVSRAISAYYHYMRYNLIPHEDIEVGLNNILDNYHEDKSGVASEILEYGLYGRYLNIWLDSFDKEKFLVFRTEEFGKDSEVAFKRLFEFLEIDNVEVPILNDKKKNIGIYNTLPLTMARLASRVKVSVHGEGHYTKRRKSSLVTAPIWYPLERLAFFIESKNQKKECSDFLKRRLADFYLEDQKITNDLFQQTVVHRT
tara:strand:- start:8864 stop:9697 length:834 start_codon:yes stop_codon:yes gene_type:complete